MRNALKMYIHHWKFALRSSIEEGNRELRLNVRMLKDKMDAKKQLNDDIAKYSGI